MTCIDMESNFMEVWIMKDHDKKWWSKRHSINIGVFTKKKPHVSPLAFCNADVVLMGEYFPDMISFNFKTGHIDTLWLGKGLLHGCFPFQLTFATEEKAQLVHHPNAWSSRRNNPKKMWRIARASKIKPKSWWAKENNHIVNRPSPMSDNKTWITEEEVI
jgi:hypothetical protein